MSIMSVLTVNNSLGIFKSFCWANIRQYTMNHRIKKTDFVITSHDLSRDGLTKKGTQYEYPFPKQTQNNYVNL